MSKFEILTIIHEMQASLEIHQWCQNQILNRFITSTENYSAKVHLPPSQPLSSHSYASHPLPPPPHLPPLLSAHSPPLYSSSKTPSFTPSSTFAVRRTPPCPQPVAAPPIQPRSENQWSHTPRTTPVLPIRHLSPTEINEKYDRGLCFNCDKKLSDTHRCRSKYLLLLGTDEDDDGYSKPPDLTVGVNVTAEGISKPLTLIDSESPPPPELHPSPPPTSPPTELPLDLTPPAATPPPISPPPIPHPPSPPPPNPPHITPPPVPRPPHQPRHDQIPHFLHCRAPPAIPISRCRHLMLSPSPPQKISTTTARRRASLQPSSVSIDPKPATFPPPLDVPPILSRPDLRWPINHSPRPDELLQQLRQVIHYDDKHEKEFHFNGSRVHLCGEPPPETLLICLTQLRAMANLDEKEQFLGVSIWPTSIDEKPNSFLTLRPNISGPNSMTTTDQGPNAVCLLLFQFRQFQNVKISKPVTEISSRRSLFSPVLLVCEKDATYRSSGSNVNCVRSLVQLCGEPPPETSRWERHSRLHHHRHNCSFV